jgi:hypothetical protein
MAPASISRLRLQVLKLGGLKMEYCYCHNESSRKGDKPGLTVESDVRALHADGVVGGPVVQDVRGLHYLCHAASEQHLVRLFILLINT